MVTNASNVGAPSWSRRASSVWRLRASTPKLAASASRAEAMAGPTASAGAVTVKYAVPSASVANETPTLPGLGS